jgi:uncharacterized CHY-type Zn-finger protein
VAYLTLSNNSQQIQEKEDEMVQIFYVICPKCRKRFYAEHATMYKTGAEFHCPFCHERFLEGLEADNSLDQGGQEYAERSS